MMDDTAKLHILTAMVLAYKPFSGIERDITREFMHLTGVTDFSTASPVITFSTDTLRVEETYTYCLYCKRHTILAGFRANCYACTEELNKELPQVKSYHLLAYQHFQWILHTLGIDAQRRFLYNLHTQLCNQKANKKDDKCL